MRHILLFLLTAYLVLGVAPDTPAVEANAWIATIQELYEQHDPDLQPYLLEELTQFEVAHPRNERLAAIWFYRGNLLVEKKEHEALAAWLKILVLAPDYQHAAIARDGILRIATEKGKYKTTAAEFRETLDDLPLTGSSADRHFHYLEMLRLILHKGLHDATIRECYAFSARYPTDSRTDRVLVWQSDTYAAAGDEDAAVAVLHKAERLFPQSELRPDMMRRRGLLLFEKLKKLDQAEEVFTELNESFPDHAAGALALFDRGQIKAKQKDPEGAAADYQAFADRYPDNEKTLDVLFELANLTRDKLKAWERTDAIYEDIIRRFPGDERALEALESSAKLNRDKLKNLKLAAAQFTRAGELFPGHEDAPSLALTGASLAKDKLKDLNLAITYWEQIREIWPDSEPARKAAKEIEKAQKKLAEGQ